MLPRPVPYPGLRKACRHLSGPHLPTARRRAYHRRGHHGTLVDGDGPPFKLVFSGDLGGRQGFIMPPPTPIEAADFVMIESAYGDRLHRRPEATVTELGKIIATARGEGGNILNPPSPSAAPRNSCICLPSITMSGG